MSKQEEFEQKIKDVHGDIVKIDFYTYKNNNTKARFVDAEYGEWWTIPKSVLNGTVHPKRANAKIALSRIKTIDFVIKKIKDRHGDRILIKESTYVSATVKATFVDVEYGEFTTTPSLVMSGKQHPKRSFKESRKKLITTAESAIGQLKNRFGDKVTLDVSTYVSAKENARFVDQDGNERWAPLQTILRTDGNFIALSQRFRLKDAVIIQKIKQHHNDNVAIDLSTYVNNRTKARFVDKDYGEWWALPDDVMSGHSHYLRGVEKQKITSTMKIEELVIKIYEVHGDLVAIDPETYVNTHKRCRFIDKDYGEFWANPNAVLSKKQRHPITKILKMTDYWVGDITLSQFSEQKGVPYATSFHLCKRYGIEHAIKYIEEYDGRGNDLEKTGATVFNLPIFNQQPEPNWPYRPDFKISDNVFINCDGLYWHSEIKKDKNYHLNMREFYEKNSKRIIQFYSDEIYEKKEIVASIARVASETCSKVFARNTNASVIDHKTASVFLNENHLMGSIKAKHIGLFCKKEGKLLSVISFVTKKGITEISRFCSAKNTVVVGGFSKLLKLLIKNSNAKHIISYCDLRYATGISYEKLGFQKTSVFLSWQWTDGHNRFNRRACRANMDERRLTELEHAEELGWYKIYDAGQAKYELRL